MRTGPQFMKRADDSSLPDADTFRLVAETRQRLAEVAHAARNAIKTHYTDPDRLIAFIESHQTAVYVLKGGWLSVFFLWILGLEPGFIPPGGFRYRLLQLWLNLQAFFPWHRISGPPIRKHRGHGVFILTPSLLTAGFLSHQIHHWLAFRAGLDGYDQRAQKLYRQFWSERNGTIGNEVYRMSAEEILALKAAINRDLEALQFLRTIASEILIPARQARRITVGKASA